MRDEIVAAARSCLDTPFKHQGRVPGVGIDCAGLGVHVMYSLGLPYKDLRGYGPIPHEGRLKAILDMQPSFERIKKEQSEAGDILLIRIGKNPSHVAIQTGPESIIHAYQVVGRVVEHRMDAEWRKSIISAYRIVRPE